MRYPSIQNKKGMTLIELMVAIAIFGMVSLITFSIVMAIPKYVRQESAQFSERTAVRRAQVDITRTIQSADTVIVSGGGSQFQFRTGTVTTSYAFTGGKVLKSVNGNVTEFINPAASFGIASPDNEAFTVSIGTEEEGKNYSFNVSKRNHTDAVTEVTISTIEPDTAVYTKGSLMDITVALHLNGNSFISLMHGGGPLTPGTDYTVSGNNYTIKGAYLETLPVGQHSYLTFNVSGGADPILDIEVTGMLAKIAANASGDDTVTMLYPGNIKVAGFNKTWTLQVTSGTVRPDVSAIPSHLSITGLPAGLTKTAAAGPGNTIVITVAGTAGAPVNTDIINGIHITVLSGAVTESAMLNSDPVAVSLLTGYIPSNPEFNLLYTSEITLNDGATITGDIFLGGGADTIRLSGICRFYGTVYCRSNLEVNNGIIVQPNNGEPAQVLIKGYVRFSGDSSIDGNLYYQGTFTDNNRTLVVTGIQQQQVVDIPPVSIPPIKTEQWYIDNGYTVVPNSWAPVPFVDNGKYYFRAGYSFNPGTLPAFLSNVRFASAGNITFSTGTIIAATGVIYAPNGNITFNNGSNFTGVIVSRKTILNGSTTLVYEVMPDLPF